MKKLHNSLTAFLLITVFLLSGCAEQTNPLASDADTSSEFSESNSENSTESGEKSIEDFSENTDENSTSSSDEYQPYQEIYLDQQYLETLEQDRLYVRVYLYMDEEAIRADYEKKYPELVGAVDQVYTYYWTKFLINRGDQIVRDFASDYDINYEELEHVFKMGGTFGYELDKDTISTMLNDTRVAEIIYTVGDPLVIRDF